MDMTAVQVQTAGGVLTGVRQQATASMGILDSFSQIIAGMVAAMQEQGEGGAQGVQGEIPMPEEEKAEQSRSVLAAMQLLAGQPVLYEQLPLQAAPALDTAVAEALPSPNAAVAQALPLTMEQQTVTGQAVQPMPMAESVRENQPPANREAHLQKDAFGNPVKQESGEDMPGLKAEYSRASQGEGEQEAETSDMAQRQFRSTVDLVKSRLQEKRGSGEAEEIDIDRLQGRVDAQKSFGTVMAKKVEAAAGEPRLSEQLSTGIAEKLQKGENEFTLRLKPRELGEITVKLIEKAGKTTLSIVTASTQTAKLINADLSSLREALRPMQVEVRDAVQHTEEAPQGFLNFDMSGGQQSSGGRQAFNEKQPLYYGGPTPTETATEEEPVQKGPPQNEHYIMM